MRNVELKSRDPDPAHSLELALALGATDEGEIVQRDTYFGGSRARVKLREQTPGDRAHDTPARLTGILYENPSWPRKPNPARPAPLPK